MGLDLSLSGFIQASGFVAYVLVALLWLASRGARGDRLLFAGLLGVQGILGIHLSLTTPEAGTGVMDRIGPLIVGVGAVLTMILAAAYALASARRASRRAVWIVGAALAILAGMTIAFLATGGVTPGKGDPALIPPGVLIVYALVLAGYAATAVAGGALALRWRADRAATTALLGASLLVLPVAWLMDGAATTLRHTFYALFLLACVLAWLPPWPVGKERVGRRVLLGLLAASLLFRSTSLPSLEALDGLFLALFAMLAALGLAIALFRARADGIEPPEFTKRRGPLAATALALLFIVAQIAQNFLEAQYGLLMGGLVAGAFLFAANPIHRAMERASAPAPAAPTARADPSHEEVFLNALRVALRDKRLTRAEEIHLHRLAAKLGIDAGRAHELLVQAETEAGVA